MRTERLQVKRETPELGAGMAPAACICDPGHELTAAVDKLAAHTTWFEGARSAQPPTVVAR